MYKHYRALYACKQLKADIKMLIVHGAKAGAAQYRYRSMEPIGSLLLHGLHLKLHEYCIST